MSKMKVYIVSYGPAPGIASRTEALVRATSPARAERHIVQSVLGLACEYAEQEVLARVVGEGVMIVDAKEA